MNGLRWSLPALPSALSVIWFATAALWGADVNAQVTDATRWADPSHVKLGVEFPGEGYHADWELFRCDCGDLLVRSELNVPGEVEAGETLLVGGRAVLSRGFAGAAELGASLDAPALMMQLALRLLERAEPGGPAKVTESRNIEVLEENDPIHLESYSAVGGFQAPWSLQAEVAPVSESRRRFDLHFEFTVAAEGGVQQGDMRLKGVADYAALEFPLAGTTRLQGWNINWRDEQDPAAPEAAEAGTLDDLRGVIREN
jgi:hypothetical protein